MLAESGQTSSMPHQLSPTCRNLTRFFFPMGSFALHTTYEKPTFEFASTERTIDIQGF